jgi:hypothetical protein
VAKIDICIHSCTTQVSQVEILQAKKQPHMDAWKKMTRRFRATEKLKRTKNRHFEHRMPAVLKEQSIVFAT